MPQDESVTERVAAPFAVNVTLRLADVSETSTSTGTQSVDDYSKLAVVLPAVYIAICLIGTVGNGLVIVVLVMRAKLRSVPTLFMLNLAIADLLFMLTLPFMAHTTANTGAWGYGLALCKFVKGFDGMNQFTGIFILTAMSVDRYLAIVRPMTCRRIRTVKRAKLVNLTIWTVSFLVSLPLWIFASVTEDTRGRYFCEVMWPNPVKNSLLFLIYAFAIGFVLPLGIIAISYLKLCLHLWNVQKSATRLSMAPFVREGSRRLTIIVVVIVVAFVVCWLPFYITNFIGQTLPPKSKPPFSFFMGYVFALFLSYLNSCLNPIIYSFLGARFGKSDSRRRSNISASCRLPRIAETPI